MEKTDKELLYRKALCIKNSKPYVEGNTYYARVENENWLAIIPSSGGGSHLVRSRNFEIVE